MGRCGWLDEKCFYFRNVDLICTGPLIDRKKRQGPGPKAVGHPRLAPWSAAPAQARNLFFGLPAGFVFGKGGLRASVPAAIIPTAEENPGKLNSNATASQPTGYLIDISSAKSTAIVKTNRHCLITNESFIRQQIPLIRLNYSIYWLNNLILDSTVIMELTEMTTALRKPQK